MQEQTQHNTPNDIDELLSELSLDNTYTPEQCFDLFKKCMDDVIMLLSNHATISTKTYSKSLEAYTKKSLVVMKKLSMHLAPHQILALKKILEEASRSLVEEHKANIQRSNTQ